ALLKASLPWTMDRPRAQNIYLLEFSSTGRTRSPFGQGGKSMSNFKPSDLDSLEVVAGNGLINRRALLGRGIALAGATTAGASAAFTSAGAEPLPVDPWSLAIGSPIPAYETPSKYEKHVVRTLTDPNHEPRTSNA